MVIAGEVLGELEAGVLVVRHDPVHDAGLLEHDEVPVGAALGETVLLTQDLGDGEGAVRGPENADQRHSLGRGALVHASEPSLYLAGNLIRGTVVDD